MTDPRDQASTRQTDIDTDPTGDSVEGRPAGTRDPDVADDRESAGDPGAAGDRTAPDAELAPAVESATDSDSTPRLVGDPPNGATGVKAGDQRWRDLQARFVDDPETVTREAADMVKAALARLTQSLHHTGDDSTENLRTEFRHYREVYRILTDA
jgi:hypothetical protein